MGYIGIKNLKSSLKSNQDILYIIRLYDWWEKLQINIFISEKKTELNMLEWNETNRMTKKIQ